MILDYFHFLVIHIHKRVPKEPTTQKGLYYCNILSYSGICVAAVSMIITCNNEFLKVYTTPINEGIHDLVYYNCVQLTSIPHAHPVTFICTESSHFYRRGREDFSNLYSHYLSATEHNRYTT